MPELGVAFAIALGFLALRQHRRRGRVHPRAILRALLASRRILAHRSTRADLICYGINTFAISTLIGWGVFSGNTVSALTVHCLDGVFGRRAPAALPGWALRAGITVAAFLGYELGYYLDHVMKHKIPFLWAFHKTHHSAQVLTPLTVFRVHPIDTLIFVDIVAATAGLAHGVFTFAAGRSVGIYLVDGTNVLFIACFFLLAQLQHSQFWMPLRGLPGRLVLSPAHHQLHHSLDPAHHNRNFGSFLALWDWAFGTLAMPEARAPGLRFGVEQDQPHRLETLLVAPFKESGRFFVKKLRKKLLLPGDA